MYNHKQQLGYFEDITSNRIVVRVKFVGNGETASYSIGTSVKADTNLNLDLLGKTGQQLQDLCLGPSKFALAESRTVYREVSSGTTSAALTIPLGIVNKTAIIGGFGVVTTSCGGTQTYSVGVPGNTAFILGAVAGTDLSVPDGASSAIWSNTYPYASATPTAAGVGAGRVYYAPDRVIAPGTPINLYVTTGTKSTLGTGDLTFELFATAFGKETYGLQYGKSTQRGSFGEDNRTLSPLF
jgi:hypothetical protein